MTDTFLSSLQIEKLGHNIQEIRERALHNVISKLGFGPVHEMDIGRIKQLLQKLFTWFQLQPISCESTVLKLIRQILESQHGPSLINFYGPKMLVDELVDIGKVVDRSCHNILDGIVNVIDANDTNDNIDSKGVFIPPLESKVALSSRYDCGDRLTDAIGTTATSIRGNVAKDPSLDLQLGFLNSDRTDSSNMTTPKIIKNERVHFKYYILNWQSLVGPDCHVLESVEESLRNPSQAAVLMHSCEFFNEVLLQDFPAEVFLQRPAIVMLFQHLLSTCRSSRITTSTLICLNKLTKCLKTRIHFYSDPNTHNLKYNDVTSSSLPSPASGDSSNNSSTINYPSEDILFLKTKQMPIPQFCLSTLNCLLNYLFVKPSSISKDNDRPARKNCQVGVNTSVLLLNQLINILKLCFVREVWQNNTSDTTKEILNMLQECLIKYGDLLEHFRLDIVSNHNQSKRITYLHLIYNVTALLDILPSDQVENNIPNSLKSALSATILDASLSRLFPKLHQAILEIVKKFDGKYEVDSCSKYDQMQEIFDSMSSAIKFLKEYKNISLVEAIHLVKGGLESLEFHRDFSFIHKFFDMCSSKLSLNCYEEDFFKSIDSVILPLLAHSDNEIREVTYKLCRKIVDETIGTKFASSSEPGSQNLFLLRPLVLKEIILHGLSSENEVIADCADDIIVLLLKSKILVSANIWQKTVEVFIPNLHLLVCFTSNKTGLSRTVISILDPDKADTLQIPTDQVLKGNCCLLFSNIALIRSEAISRICWLLSSDANSLKLLPKLHNLHDKSLSLICQLNRTHDLNKPKSSQHFYQPSSLHQVLDLLSSSANVEPVIRRSALTQISVMTEDPLLHLTFQQRGGVAILLSAMRSALTEGNYSDYPDSVVPIMATLKNLCLYSVAIRQELACDVDVIRYIIRGLTLFSTDGRAKQDGAILLFLLLFNSVLKGSPNKHDFSIPDLVLNKLNVPFICKTHSKISLNALPTVADNFLSDKWCLSALKIHWNSDYFGGFKEVLNWEKISYDKNVPFNNILRLSENDLDALKYASLEFCIRENLKEVYTANSYTTVENSINLLTNCINLYNLTKNDYTTQTNLTSFTWKPSFIKFLEARPGSNEDAILLTGVIKFLTILSPIYKISDEPCWISTLLKDKVHCLTDILNPEFFEDIESKKLSQSLLQLITVCVNNEQSFLSLYTINNVVSDICSDWNFIVVQIVEHLKFNNTQHFYNLAYLDSLLSCLVQLTVALGWSQNNSQNINVQNKHLLSKLVSGLCELLEAFHSGKGASASSSLMGLSITRNILIILNHTLVEVQYFNVQDWEDLFLEENINGENILTSFSTLLSSRDVVLRTAVVQLFTGLSLSLKLSIKLIQIIRYNHSGFWETFLAIILDHEEASIVRENATALLSNILYHTIQNQQELEIVSKLIPLYTNRPNAIYSLISFLEENQFYKELEIILTCLYVEKEFYYDLSNTDVKITHENSSNIPTSLISNKKDEYIFAYTKNIPITIRSVSSNGCSSTLDNQIGLTTPGFIKNISQFISQLIVLAPTEINDILQENNIVRILFKCITIPEINLVNTKDVSNYCEVIFMNKALVNTISTAVNTFSVCRHAILHTRDCLNITIALLNPHLFCVELPQLLNLRNELWLEIFQFLVNLLQTSNDANINLTKSIESVNVIISVIEESGFEAFVEALCDSISRNNFPNLQYAALSALISLLRIATISESPKNVMQNLFDTTLSPRSEISDQFDEQLENLSPNIVRSTSPTTKKKTLLTLLENVYFGNIGTDLKTVRSKRSVNEIDSCRILKSGAALCKILIRLHELHTLKNVKNSKLKSVLISGLTALLCVSLEAKQFAYENKFVIVVLQQLKEIYVKLSLESIDSMRKVADKRRLQPVLKEMGALFGLLTNFMIGYQSVKCQASVVGLSDLVHKLWIWCTVQKALVIDVLKMMCTYTTNCSEACQSLTMTSSLAGLGPRKQTSNACLLNAITTQIGKEMDLASRTHDLATLQLCFHLLHNSCEVTECRNVLVKSNILQFLTRLHPAITKRQKPYENIEFIWLNFLLTFTAYAEGQSCFVKIPDAFDLLLTLTACPKIENKLTALMVLRNLAFYSSNRPRLLTSDDFMNVLNVKLSSGSIEEKYIVVTILWSLAANNQKAKLVFKCAQLDLKLHEAIKVLQMSEDVNITSAQLKQMYYVLNLLRDGEKSIR